MSVQDSAEPMSLLDKIDDALAPNVIDVQLIEDLLVTARVTGFSHPAVQTLQEKAARLQSGIRGASRLAPGVTDGPPPGRPSARRQSKRTRNPHVCC